MVIYVSVENSDDKLTQAEWHLFVADVRGVLRMFSTRVRGSWFSLPDEPWQSACWCAEFEDADREGIAKVELGRLATRSRQDSIVWAKAPVTESLTGTHN